jgi:hypothetical protein
MEESYMVCENEDLIGETTGLTHLQYLAIENYQESTSY